MILLETSWLICLYLFFSITALIVVGIIKRRKRPFRHPSLFDLSFCEFCGGNYLESTLKKVTKCPHCNSWNKTVDKRS